MVEFIDGNTGELVEAPTLADAAAQAIEPPPYWRKTAHIVSSIEEGEWGVEFDTAFLAAQMEIGPVIWAESENSFNESKYASLGALLAKVQPILNKCGFFVNTGGGKLQSRGDVKQLLLLPGWLKLTHAATGQWKRVYFEMPVAKHDAQSFGGLLTYLRRYMLESYLSLKATDDDGVMASIQSTLQGEQLEKMMTALQAKILACKSEADLHSWRSKNEQQFKLLDDDSVGVLRKAWQARLQDIKPPAAKNGKPKKEEANG